MRAVKWYTRSSLREDGLVPGPRSSDQKGGSRDVSRAGVTGWFCAGVAQAIRSGFLDQHRPAPERGHTPHAGSMEPLVPRASKQSEALL
ncbi:hypothetical protein XAB3213_900057 [Xanthomonas citri pv. bilvae]|nr:hypothetical protein XAB3213_900057 [Xanthomonas citri pv. bilvae]